MNKSSNASGKKAKIVATLNAKGGVGKTTTNINLAVLLARKYKVLVIDFDAQCDLSKMAGLRLRSEIDMTTQEMRYKYTMCGEAVSAFADALVTTESLSEYVIESKIHNVDLLCGGKRLKDVMYELHNLDLKCEPFTDWSAKRREELGVTTYTEILRNKLKEFEYEYDYIFIDCGPQQTTYFDMTLLAADLIIATIKVDQFSYEALNDLFNEVRRINIKYGLMKQFRVLFTQVNSRTNVFNDLYAQYQQEFGRAFLLTTIRNETSVSEASTELIPLPIKHAKSKACADYVNLLDELKGELEL